MKSLNFSNFLLFGLSLSIILLQACGSSDEPTIENQTPTVGSALTDVTYDEGFQMKEISLATVFIDADNDVLTYTATSSESSVVSVEISGSTLKIIESGIGSSIIKVIASDGKNGIAENSFSCTISAVSVGSCTLDNSLDMSLSDCRFSAQQAGLTASVSDKIEAGKRVIETNNVPNHDFGSPTDKIMAVNFTWKMPASPVKASQTTPLIGMVRLDFQFGVGLNGVKMDPAANFPYENTSTGEMNYEWVLEAINNTTTTTLDCNQAHLQADGAYHYHGDFVGYAALLGATGNAMVQVGWAADGFPVYYKYAYSDASSSTSNITEMKSSYRAQSGDRPGDGASAPCGEFNGKYEQDYEYVSGLGDLDECNGRTGVTPEYPNGTYYYLITADYPAIPRCFWGTPDNSFRIGG